MKKSHMPRLTCAGTARPAARRMENGPPPLDNLHSSPFGILKVMLFWLMIFWVSYFSVCACGMYPVKGRYFDGIIVDLL